MRSSRKGVMDVWMIVGMITLLAFLFIAVFIFLRLSHKEVSYASFGCWFSLAFKQGFPDIAKDLFAQGCRLQTASSLDEKTLASKLVEVWWMRGQGDWDETNDDTIFVAYSFALSKDIPIMELIEYMRTRNEGMPVEVKYSDYAYIQKGSKGQTLCFEKKIFDEGKTLKSGKNYFIIFYDDQDAGDTGDKLMITTTPNEGSFYPVHCDSPNTRQTIVIDELGEYHLVPESIL